MKQFLLFKGDQYYPDGGWYDLAGSYDTLTEAQADIKNGDWDPDWYHIVDTSTQQIVEKRN